MKWFEESSRQKKGWQNISGIKGSPHPFLSSSIVPLSFSRLALFGHVTAARAGERKRRKEKGEDGQIVFFSSS